jgi:hypothetical protein
MAHTLQTESEAEIIGADAAPTRVQKLIQFENTLWYSTAIGMTMGYLCLGKSFAYIGIPQRKVFVGEIFLAALLLMRPGVLLGNWCTALLGHSVLSNFGWGFLIFLSYGICELLHAVAKDYSALVAAQNLVFNIYPVYVFVGFWVASQSKDMLETAVRAVALFDGVYGAAYVVILGHYPILIPVTRTNLVGQPGGCVVALLGLVIFGGRGPRWNLLMLLNAFVLLGAQVRSDWLGVLVGLFVWAILTNNLKKMMQGIAALALLLGLGLVSDVQISGVSGRSDTISTRQIVGRAIAGVDLETAQEFTSEADSYAGTISWRTTWWKEIWTSVHANTVRTFFGHGYGFPLADLVHYKGTDVIATRTPHNIFYYALGYTGWVGVILFAFFQLVIAASQWQVYRETGQSYGIAL